MKLMSTNPARGYSTIGGVDVSSSSEIKLVIETSKQAQTKWANLGLTQRLTFMRKLKQALLEDIHTINLITAEETGRPITSLNNLSRTAFGYLDYYLETAEAALSDEITYQDEREINLIVREPRGVIACIQPWNFPFMNVIWQTIQALLAGNSIILKTSEEDPLFCQKISEVFNSVLPEGVFLAVYGDGQVGQALVNADIDMVMFTGSYETGLRIHEQLASRLIPDVLELGGSAPGLVLDDIKLDDVIDAIIAARFTNCGQTCNGLKRLIVPADTIQDTVDLLVSKLAQMKIGDPLDKDTVFGSLVSEGQLERLAGQVDNSVALGANVIQAQKIPPELNGAYYPPTIMTDISPEMPVWREEVFGPVLPVVGYRDEREALDLANDTEYGLGAYIYTNNSDKFSQLASRIHSAQVVQNGTNLYRGCNPFGGWKKSGLGLENGKTGFSEVVRVKTISKQK